MPIGGDAGVKKPRRNDPITLDRGHVAITVDDYALHPIAEPGDVLIVDTTREPAIGEIVAVQLGPGRDYELVIGQLVAQSRDAIGLAFPCSAYQPLDFRPDQIAGIFSVIERRVAMNCKRDKLPSSPSTHSEAGD